MQVDRFTPRSISILSKKKAHLSHDGPCQLKPYQTWADPGSLAVHALLPRGLVRGQRHKPSAQDFEFLEPLVTKAPRSRFA